VRLREMTGRIAGILPARGRDGREDRWPAGSRRSDRRAANAVRKSNAVFMI